MIKEWDLLRVVACLSIVLLHTTTWLNFSGAPIEQDWLLFVRVLLCFATPTFIMLSIVILAYKYPHALPKGFWSSRLKFLLLPFIFWATLDAVVRASTNSKRTFDDYIWNNLFFGGFVGWFILIILQLYFFYMLIAKWHWTRFIILPVGITLAVIHLNQLVLPESFYMQHEPLLRISFSAWMNYFAAAFILGKYYRQLAPLLLKGRYVLLVATLAAGYMMYVSFMAGNTLPESRRFDLTLFVLALTLLILAWGQMLPYFKMVRFISHYAFAIYLIHWQVLFFMTSYAMAWTEHFAVQVVLLFTFAISISIIIAMGLQKIPGGHFLVGKIKKVGS